MKLTLLDPSDNVLLQLRHDGWIIKSPVIRFGLLVFTVIRQG